MNLDSLDAKLSNIQTELHSQETHLKNMYETFSQDPDIHSFEREHLRAEYQTYLNDYERAYDIANQEYQKSIEGLSESYLSMCPFYKGPSLPKPTFIDSKQDIADLYGLFLIVGIAHMYGI